MKDISLHVLDIMQNSAAANAERICVEIRTDKNTGILEIMIGDNGCGMDSELLSRVDDPFSTTRTTRKVGLGIPLFKASAEQSGGSFEISSEKGFGTKVTARFAIDNIDRPPLGDIAGVITDMAAAYPEVGIQLLLKNGNQKFEFDSRQVAERLGEVPISEFAVVKWLREYIGEGIKDILGGVLNEINS